MLVPLLLASLLSAAPGGSSPAADSTVSFDRSLERRHARLLEGVEATAFDLNTPMRLRLADDPRLPLDTGGGGGGGGLDSGTRQVLALVLGLFIGFGTGHLVASDRDGFILFLVVDAAIIVVSSIFRIAFGGWFWGLGGVALLVSHVIQGIDALAKAGGPRIVEQTRQRAVEVADVTGGREAPPITTRAFAFTF